MDRLGATAAYLAQKRKMHLMGEALADAGIPYAIFKGAHIREVLYPDPSLRPLDDIDVLVPEPRKLAAIGALADAGMALEMDTSILSHEVKLKDGSVCVDLHWRLFRKGRSRIELALPLLERRAWQDGIWTLDATASLLVMLVHPAFTKHVSGSLSRLVRLVEIDRLIRRRDPDWDWVLELIDKAGLRTAAWSTLYWLRTFLDTSLPEQVTARLRPGQLQRAYLRWWIDHDLPRRLEGIPFLVQGAFTLALHDRPGDALRALAALVQARLQGRGVEREIRSALATGSGRA
jgi:hypothetical protein